MASDGFFVIVAQAIHAAVVRDADLILSGADVANFSVCCRSPVRHLLQSAAWRLRAHAARRQVRAVGDATRGQLAVVGRMGRQYVAIVDRITRLFRSNLVIRGSLEERVRHVIAGFSVQRAVVAAVRRSHPEMQQEIDLEEWRANQYLGIDTLVSDASDSEPGAEDNGVAP